MVKQVSDEEIQSAISSFPDDASDYEIAKAVYKFLGYSDWRPAKTRIARTRKLAEVELPEFPDDDISAEEILAQHATRFVQRQKHADSLKWFEIKMPLQPMALVWFGDPHLGNNGCNTPLLLKHIDIISNTPNMYGANIGDTVDNWSGRLERLYAENDVSKATERKLAVWFLKAVPWLLWLQGNHDLWDEVFTAYLRAHGGHRLPMMDWGAKFKLTFPNGAEVRWDAAHNHKGHSMWNELHGQTKAALMGEPADIYIAGHHHNYAYAQKEVNGRLAHLCRVRGYKYIDSYADKLGFQSSQYGASVAFLVNPFAEGSGRIRFYEDIELCAEELERLNAKAA